MATAAVAEFRGLGRWLALVAAVVALGLATLFVARRLLEPPRRGLDGAELLLLTQLLVGSVLGFRCVWRRGLTRSDLLAKDLAIHLVPSAAAVLFAGAVSSAESPLWAVIVLWMALTCAETWFWMSVLSSPLRRLWTQRGAPFSPVRTDRRDAASVVPHNNQHLPTETRGEEEESRADSDEESFPPDCLQQIRRLRDTDGAEAVHGLLRLELAPGQRVHHLHVAFCPPLPAAPEFAIEQLEGPEATLTAGQVEPYGARIDLRLASPAREGQNMMVEFYARAVE
jgi:hypothetical protein